MLKVSVHVTTARTLIIISIISLYLLFPNLSVAGANDLGIMSEAQMSLISSHLREKQVADQFIPEFYANAGLTRDDPDNSKFEATIVRTSDQNYVKKINEIFLKITPLLRAAFKCKKDLVRGRRNSFQMVGVTQTAEQSEPSRLFKDSWKFQLCEHRSEVNFLTIESHDKIPVPQLFYVGKSAAGIQLLADTNRVLSLAAAAELRKRDKNCSGPASSPLIDARVVNGSPSRGQWTEEWLYSYCRQIGTFTIDFVPSPAIGDYYENAPNGGTTFRTQLKSIDTF